MNEPDDPYTDTTDNGHRNNWKAAVERKMIPK